jgi:tRNA A37 threonylcarbamoyladenosine biosynthesis protein TsaE
MDLYRLSGKSAKDFDPLDLRRVFSNCISLIEWPSRLQAFPELLPQEDTLLKIDIRIPDPTSDERVMSLVSTNESSWTFRIKNLIEEGMIDDLLLHNDDHEDNNTGDETSDSEPN